MRVIITIDAAEDGEMSMGVAADGMDQLEIFRMLIAGAEMAAFQHVTTSLMDNGATAEEAAYAAPIRARLLAIEQLTQLDMQPYSWIELDGS